MKYLDAQPPCPIMDSVDGRLSPPFFCDEGRKVGKKQFNEAVRAYYENYHYAQVHEAPECILKSMSQSQKMSNLIF